MVESGELEQTRDAHADYYLALAEEAVSDAHGTDQAAQQEKQEREAGNVQAACEWLMEHKRKEEAQRLSRFRGDTSGEATTSTYLNTISPDRDEEGIFPKVLPLRSTEPLSFIAYEELTTRETEVLRLLALGLSNKKIAERLVISPHTVNGHIHSIFGKLALNSRSAATRYALEHQLA